MNSDADQDWAKLIEAMAGGAETSWTPSCGQDGWMRKECDFHVCGFWGLPRSCMGASDARPEAG